jgi:hypothetical protein
MRCNLRSASLLHLRIAHRSCLGSLVIAMGFVCLTGCSGVSSLQVDSPQPVYFGTPSKGLITLDSAHAKLIGPLVATTSHTSEDEKTRSIKHFELNSGGGEKAESSIEKEVAKAVEKDSNNFIGDVSVSARVEAYVPWYSVVFDLVSMAFSQSTTLGDDYVSSETITIAGKVYRQWRVIQ